jgi:hypothetical protein
VSCLEVNVTITVGTADSRLWFHRSHVQIIFNLCSAAEQAPPTTPSTARRGTTSRPRSSTVAQLFPPFAPVPPSAGPPAAPPPTAAGLPMETGVKTAAEAEAEAESDAASEKGGHELDAHVRHILSQSKRDAIKRTARGVWTFVKTPMGAITAIYGFLVAFWGAAIVLFLLGWINAGSKYQNDVWVEISSQVENGLFTLTGVGLIPWRVIDVYSELSGSVNVSVGPFREQAWGMGRTPAQIRELTSACSRARTSDYGKSAVSRP